jgi:hypothetical protein
MRSLPSPLPKEPAALHALLLDQQRQLQELEHALREQQQKYGKLAVS